MTPVPKRRRGVGRCNRYNDGYMPSASLTSLKYTVDESPEGYTLWLSKKVPRGMIAEAVNEQISHLKEESYRPTYHLVRDLWGNPYFVEEEADEESLLREALSKLDMKAINHKIARNLFQEYEIDLNHRGDQLTVSSRRDGITKSFEIGSCIEDIRVTGCKLDDKQEYAVLRIELIKSDECKGQSSDLAKLIQWSQSQAIKQRAEEEKEKEAEEVAAAEAKAKAEAQLVAKLKAEAQAKREAEAKEKAEAELKAKLVAEAQAKREAETKKKVEAELKAKLEAEAQAKREVEAKREFEAQLRAKFEAEAARRERRRVQELLRQEEEEKRFHEQELKERKAFLIGQQRAKRLRAERKASHSPKTVTININFGNEDSMNENEEHQLKRIQSPVLEDVDDEETERFNESLSRSPRGSSIIEDV